MYFKMSWSELLSQYHTTVCQAHQEIYELQVLSSIYISTVCLERAHEIPSVLNCKQFCSCKPDSPLRPVNELRIFIISQKTLHRNVSLVLAANTELHSWAHNHDKILSMNQASLVLSLFPFSPCL